MALHDSHMKIQQCSLMHMPQYYGRDTGTSCEGYRYFLLLQYTQYSFHCWAILHIIWVKLQCSTILIYSGKILENKKNSMCACKMAMYVIVWRRFKVLHTSPDSSIYNWRSSAMHLCNTFWSRQSFQFQIHNFVCTYFGTWDACSTVGSIGAVCSLQYSISFCVSMIPYEKVATHYFSALMV